MHTIREFTYAASDYRAVADLFEAVCGNNHHRPEDIQHMDEIRDPEIRFARFVDEVVGKVIAEAFFFAVDGDRYVAITGLTRYDEITYMSDLTRTTPSYQGLGVELAIKLRDLKWAKENGATNIVDDAVEEDLVYQINRVLGFEHLPTWSILEKRR